MLLLVIKPPLYVAAKIHSLPWIDPRRKAKLLHETVLPIGDRTAVGSCLDQVIDRLGSLDAMPFEVCFDRIVATPGRAAKLVSSKPQPAQRRLYRSALSSLESSDIEMPAYKFSPHVTLHYDWPGPALREDIEPIRWLVDTLLLIESFHGERRHEELCRWPLRPRQGTLFPFLSCTMPMGRAA